MYRTKKISFISCLTLVLIGFSSPLKAISGAELAYECLGANQYRIILQVYRDCSEATLPSSQTIDLNSTNCSAGFTTTLNLEQSYEVSGIHPDSIGNSTCNGGTLPGFELFVYTDTITLPQTCSDWLIAWTGCCRSSNITNLSTVGSSIYVEAQIDSRYLYSSPQFNRQQLAYYCANSNTNSEFHGPTNYPANMDSFVTTLTCPLQGANNCLPYAAGLSINEPFHLASGTSIIIDNLARDVLFDAENNLAQVAAIATTIYQLKNGDTVGYVQSEIPLVILDSISDCNDGIRTSPPLLFSSAQWNPFALYDIDLCAGEVSIFNIIVEDLDGDTISIAPLEVNLEAVFGASNYTIFVVNSPPFRHDSIQVFVQITPALNPTYNPLQSNTREHIRLGFTDNGNTYPSYTYMDMNFTFIEVVYRNQPKICPYAPMSIPLEALIEQDSLVIPGAHWEQISGPPVSFSDTAIYNPIITTTPSVHGDSIVLELTAITPPDPATGASCVLTSRLVLEYDSSGYCNRPFPNEVVGAIQIDTNQNCLPDSLEARFPFYSILLFEKGIDSFYYAGTGTQDYEAYLDTGTYSVSIAEVDNNPYWSFCLPNQTITIDTMVNPQYLDWSVEPLFFCPKMEIDLSGNPLRACINRQVAVDYKNAGTMLATDVYIEVTMDTFLTVLNSSVPISNQIGNVYRFDIDTVDIGVAGQILLTVEANCSSAFNQPYIIDAHIYPDSFCTNILPHMVINDSCTVDTAYFQVINYVAAHSAPLVYWMIENEVVVDTGTIQLGQSQSLTLSYPVDSSQTYQLVIEPASNNYAASMPVNCISDTVSTPLLFIPNNQLGYRSTLYSRLVGSFDPNIKVAEPQGYGSEHYILPNTPIDYTIHFQNVGTDTAYQVVIWDTLSPHVNIASLEMKGASHAYTWRMMPYNAFGYTILEVRFDNILLLDSTTNEPASHGFVKYKIQQKPDLPNFTRIENSASIYFDINAPIKTNTTFHTICDTCHLMIISDYSVITDTKKALDERLMIRVYPNPISGNQLTIEQEVPQLCQVELYTLSGVLLKQKEINQNVSTLDMKNLAVGAYFLRITSDTSNQVFKIIKQ